MLNYFDQSSYVFLPAAHIGSPRHLAMLFQDAMAKVRRYKKPDFFIPFMCNPEWPENLNQMRLGESVWMSMDLAVRVLKVTLDQLLDDILNKNVLAKLLHVCM